MMKNIALPLVCLLVGGAAGYALRCVSESGEMQSAQSDGIGAEGRTTGPRTTASAGAATGKTAATAGSGGSGASGSSGLSLSDRMKEQLVDYDPKSAQKAAAKLSASDLQAALALVAAMPKSAERDALRAQLYRAWAAINPNAAWQAALNDPLDKDKGTLLAAVAGEVAKKNPTAAIDLAMSLGMGGRRTTVMSAVFGEWSMVDAAAAIAYSNAHPDLPMDSFAITRGLSSLAEKQPMQAANLVITFKDEMQRNIALSNLMNTWVGSAPSAAFDWAQSLTNPAVRQSAIAAAIGAWAKIDPVAALAQAQGIPDNETRVSSFKKGWSDWFRSNPTAATSYLASTTDEALLQSVRFDFSYYSENYSPKERAALLAQIPEGKNKEDIMRTITDSQIRKGQFNQALELLNAMPDSSGRDRNVVQLGQSWAKSDLAAAAAWLKLQPDSSDRDLATAGYVGTLANTDPAAALEMIKTIPDAKVRNGAMKNIALHWLRGDAAKAEAWMATVPSFSESDKKFIRSMVPLRTDSIGPSITVGSRR